MGAIWNGIKAALGHTLAFFYSLIPDYGIAIILLTVAVSLLLFPLTLKQTRSMRAMQQIQPDVKRLQKELKGDREELNKQLMELYKEEGVNPAAGCLPLLAQMPIWFALFQVLRLSVVTAAVVGSVAAGPVGSVASIQPGDRVVAVDGNDIDWWHHVEERFADGAPHELTIERDGLQQRVTLDALDGVESSGERVLNPDNVIPTESKLEEGLKAGKTEFLGMDLLISPSSAAEEGLLDAIPYIALILLVMVTGYYQQYQTTKRRDPNEAQNPQQQSMQTVMKIMPLFLGFISWGFPTGLVLYFAASAIFRIGQQAVIIRMEGEPRSAGGTEIVPPQSPIVGEDDPARKGPSPHASKKRKKRRRK
jgi:YidC/Oxa1 family membrane protein insertase